MSLIFPDTSLYRSLQQLATDKQLVFLTGLPGTGKSLMLQQLALIACDLGRQVHLLQWDVCRQPFENDAHVLAHYPEIDGVTHNGVRKSAGIWARKAVHTWYESHKTDTDILIGETPLVGNRLVELAQNDEDPAELILRDETITHFLVPTPSKEVKKYIEQQREARSANPLHEREKDDAQPHVMLAAWSEFCSVAHQMNLINADAVVEKTANYDPDLYYKIYDRLLKHRSHSRLSMERTLETDKRSVYDLHAGQIDIVPTPEEVRQALDEMERRYPDKQTLAHEINFWHVV